MSKVTITHTRSRRLKRYARHSGKSPEAVLNAAFDWWYDTYGEVVLQEMIKKNRRGPRILSFPSAQ